jgi:hypothetical protein
VHVTSTIATAPQEKKEGEEEGKIEEVDEDADKKEKKKKTVRRTMGGQQGKGSTVCVVPLGEVGCTGDLQQHTDSSRGACRSRGASRQQQGRRGLPDSS